MNLSAAAHGGLSAALARLPNAQQSQDPQSLASILSWYEDEFAGYPNDTRSRLIRVLRGLSESDDDVSSTLGEYISLVNGGYTWDFQGGARAIRNAQAATADFEQRLYPEGGGLSGLINNQSAELCVAGASSLEWVPARNRRSVERVEVVPGEEIRIRRDPGTRELVYTQVGRGEQLILNPLTYRYVAASARGRSPYGLPLFLAALFALDRKRQLSDSEQRVINLMARSALITASAPVPTPQQVGCRDENDPNYPAAVSAHFSRIADLITAGSANGLYLAPRFGDQPIEIEATPITQSVAGLSDITNSNQLRVWNALRTLPFLRGKMDSTTQALAQVVIPLVHAHAIHGQSVHAAVIAYGANLNLRLQGIPATAELKFAPPRSPYQLDEATALLRRSEAHTKLAALFGPAWAQAAMREFDVVDGDAARAPDWWNPTSGAPSPVPTPGETP